jgi:hypothetical protein
MSTAAATTAQAWRLHSPTIRLTMETSMGDYGLAARSAQAVSEFTIDSPAIARDARHGDAENLNNP